MNFRTVFFVILIVIVEFSWVQLKYIPYSQSKWKNCGTGNGHLDTSKLEFAAVNDTAVGLKGQINILKNLDEPWELEFSTERYQKKQWVPGELNRAVSDFCQVIQQQEQPWYRITSQLQNKFCPFTAGSVEKFSGQIINDMNIDIPSNFQGKWRMFLKMRTSSSPGISTCKTFEFEIIEE